MLEWVDHNVNPDIHPHQEFSVFQRLGPCQQLQQVEQLTEVDQCGALVNTRGRHCEFCKWGEVPVICN